MAIRAYWCSNDNYGDALTPYIIKAATGQLPVWTQPNPRQAVHLVTGSLLGYSLRNGIVWGCGSAFETDIQPELFSPPSDNLRVVATRGPLTFGKMVKCGHQPKAFGDPGLLLPKFFNPRLEKVHRLGIIPSWIDYPVVKEQYGSEALVINLFDPIEVVIKQIQQCELIISGALHGLVTAVAYDIPTIWVKFSDKIVGDGFKFRDFLTSIGIDPYEAINLFEPRPIHDLLHLPFHHKMEIDLNKLWDVCPFK